MQIIRKCFNEITRIAFVVTFADWNGAKKPPGTRTLTIIAPGCLFRVWVWVWASAIIISRQVFVPVSGGPFCYCLIKFISLLGLHAWRFMNHVYWIFLSHIIIILIFFNLRFWPPRVWVWGLAGPILALFAIRARANVPSIRFAMSSVADDIWFKLWQGFIFKTCMDSISFLKPSWEWS